MFAFDLNAEANPLQSQIPPGTGRISKTLVKYSDFRLVLTVMKAYSRMEEPRTPTRIFVQTEFWRLRMHVEALEDSAFLLTFAWPELKI
jgi:hypothetical protein